MGGGGEVGRHIFPRPEKNLWKNYHNGVGVLSSSTYKTDLLADMQKKKGGGGVKERDCDTFFPPNLKKICGKIIMLYISELCKDCTVTNENDYAWTSIHDNGQGVTASDVRCTPTAYTACTVTHVQHSTGKPRRNEKSCDISWAARSTLCAAVRLVLVLNMRHSAQVVLAQWK